MSEAYAGKQIVGMDLHRRRSVLVRMTESGQHLETVRISNDPEYLPNPDVPVSPAARRFAELEQRNAELTRDNRHLTEHLDLAVANLQRLTLDNHQMRQALENAGKVTRIDAKSRTP